MFCCGKAVDQLQMCLKGGVGLSAASSSPSPEQSDGLLAMSSEETYRVVTVCIDHERNEIAPVGMTPIYDTGCPFPAFGIVKPAVTNTRVDMSPYGQSVVADAVDAVQAVDLTFDALVNEIDVSKMRVFLSGVLFDREKNGGKTISIPFGKSDCTVFHKVMSIEDTIQEFAPAPRTLRAVVRSAAGTCSSAPIQSSSQGWRQINLNVASVVTLCVSLRGLSNALPVRETFLEIICCIRQDIEL